MLDNGPIEILSNRKSSPCSGFSAQPTVRRSALRANSSRCFVIASGLYEFTGAGYSKAKHRFTLNGAPCTVIAGIWRAREQLAGAFAMQTIASGPIVCCGPKLGA
jgi:hypothetical protein